LEYEFVKRPAREEGTQRERRKEAENGGKHNE
jgi:hypothetical protein